MKIVLNRLNDDGVQTLGHLIVYNGIEKVFDCKTLELANKGNRPRVSCIPVGEYEVVKRRSDRFGEHFHVKNVPGRSWILIHHGNFNTDILGCVLVGRQYYDINGDGKLDVTSSRQTMGKLLEVMPERFRMRVVEV